MFFQPFFPFGFFPFFNNGEKVDGEKAKENEEMAKEFFKNSAYFSPFSEQEKHKNPVWEKFFFYKTPHKTLLKTPKPKLDQEKTKRSPSIYPTPLLTSQSNHHKSKFLNPLVQNFQTYKSKS